jgi:hypothetical protein
VINPARRSMVAHRSVRVHASRERIEGGHADATGGARGLIVEFRVKKIHFIVVAAPWIPVVSRST